MSTRLKWVVEFSVDQIWVEDGFNPTEEQFKDMLGKFLGMAYGHEYDAKVVKTPNQKKIRKLQGYEDKR